MYFLLAILYVLRYTLQGLGKGMVPTIAGIAELLMRTVAAVFLSQLFGYPGAAVANPLAWFGSLCVLIPSYIKAFKKLRELTDGTVLIEKI